MTLFRLEVAYFRNLQHVSLSPHPELNIFFGHNGSGKTSLLEAIHLLGAGRSFRTGRVRRLVMDSQESCTVFGAFSDGRQAGIRCNAGGITDIRIDGRPASSLADLVRTLPLLLFDPLSLETFDEGSKPRRAQLDWAVFHVEQGFYPAWRHYQSALKQRNSLLRSGSIGRFEARSWHSLVGDTADQLHRLRSQFVESWQPFWKSYSQALLPGIEVSMDYLPGWDTRCSLEQLLTESWDKDVERGFTQYGPHRADIRLRVGNLSASDVLSRGQRKLAIFALKLSQLALLKEREVSCAVIVDDLGSELDAEARGRLTDALLRIRSQIFLSVIDAETVLGALRNAGQGFKLFHVEHGSIKEV